MREAWPGVEVDPAFRCDPVQGAVGPHRPHLDVVILAFPDRRLDRSLDPLTVLGLNGGEERRIGRLGAGGQAEQGFAAVRPSEVLRPQIPIPPPEARGVLRQLEIGLAFAQPRLHTQPAGYVGSGGYDLQDLAALVFQWSQLKVDGDELAFTDSDLDIVADSLACERAREGPFQALPRLFREAPPIAIPKWPADHIVARQTCGVEGGVIRLGEDSLAGQHTHKREEVIQDSPQPVLAASEARLGLSPLCNVLHDRDEVVDRSVGFPGAPDGQIHPNRRTVFADVALFETKIWNLAREHAAHQHQIRRKILGMGNVLKCFRGQLFRGIPDDFAIALVDKQPPPARRQMRNANGGILEGCPESLFGFPDTHAGGIAANALRFLRRLKNGAGVFSHSRGRRIVSLGDPLTMHQ